VVDLSRLVAGNMLSMQLGDFGADVLKVESPDSGDTLRQWREVHPDHPEGFDGWWRVYGRNKRSLALNLRNADALACLRKLLCTAHVLVESFRPGTLEAMGLAPEALHADNPALVVVRLSGWGQTGAYRELPGFGSLIEGVCGYAHKHREAKVPQLPNMALADMVAGLTGAFATLTALREVEVNGGRGQVIDLSLLEPMLAVMGPDVTNFAATGQHADPQAKIASPRGVFRCADGKWMSMSGSTDTMARRVFETIGQAELFDDPRFATNAARLHNDDEINRLIDAVVSRLELDDALALFRAKGVTVGPIYDAQGLMHDAHVVSRGCYVAATGDTPGAGAVMHNITPALSGTPGALRHLAPRRGQHTRDVLLSELGLSAETLDAMQRQGAIECG
jgi:crotonobetainyl-CoA:carnitine CoA-transferase CaiB-like acyl-CoA transferase